MIYPEGYCSLSTFSVSARTSILTNDGRYPLLAPHQSVAVLGLSSPASWRDYPICTKIIIQSFTDFAIIPADHLLQYSTA